MHMFKALVRLITIIVRVKYHRDANSVQIKTRIRNAADISGCGLTDLLLKSCRYQKTKKKMLKKKGLRLKLSIKYSCRYGRIDISKISECISIRLRSVPSTTFQINKLQSN